MAGRYPRHLWQSGIISSPYGPVNGARLQHIEDFLALIFDDFDAHAGDVGDVHTQYILEPAAPLINAPLVWTASGWVAQKLTKDNIAANAGILKSQLAPLAITAADLAANAGIPKSMLDLTGQILAGDLAPGVGTVPTGATFDYLGAVAPAGYILADGATYDGTNSTYTPLWNLIGTQHGGTGQSAFKAPDARGRVIVMLGTHADVNALGKNDGTTLANRRPAHAHVHALTLPNHTHPFVLPDHQHSGGGAGGTGPAGGGGGGPETVVANTGGVVAQPVNGVTGNPSTSPAINGTIGSQGGTSDAPSYLVLNKIIKL